MTIKSLLMAFAMVSLIACSKSGDSATTDNRPLKSVPHSSLASVHVINLEASNSEGPIVKYKWERTDTAVVTHPTSFVTATEWNDATKQSNTQVSVTKTGFYVFTLTVYDKANNSNSQFFTVVVSQ